MDVVGRHGPGGTPGPALPDGNGGPIIGIRRRVAHGVRNADVGAPRAAVRIIHIPNEVADGVGRRAEVFRRGIQYREGAEPRLGQELPGAGSRVRRMRRRSIALAQIEPALDAGIVRNQDVAAVVGISGAAVAERKRPVAAGQPRGCGLLPIGLPARIAGSWRRPSLDLRVDISASVVNNHGAVGVGLVRLIAFAVEPQVPHSVGAVGAGVAGAAPFAVPGIVPQLRKVTRVREPRVAGVADVRCAVVLRVHVITTVWVRVGVDDRVRRVQGVGVEPSGPDRIREHHAFHAVRAVPQQHRPLVGVVARPSAAADGGVPQLVLVADQVVGVVDGIALPVAANPETHAGHAR